MYKFKAAATELPTLLMFDGDEVTGPLSIIYDIFKWKLNNSFTVSVIGRGALGELYSNQNGSGALGSLIRNETDFSILTHFLNKEAVDWLDYTAVAGETDWDFISGPASNFTKNYFESVKSFRNTLWISIITSMLSFSFIWTVLERLNHQGLRKPFPTSLLNSLFLSYAVLFNKEVYKSNKLRDRLLWISWILGCFILSLSFTCVMFSKLAKKDDPFRYEKMEDFFTHPMRLLVLKDTPPHIELKNSHDETKMKLWKKIQEENTLFSYDDGKFFDAYNDITEGRMSLVNTRVVVLTIFTILCGDTIDFHISKEPFYTSLLTFLMRKDLDANVKRTINYIALQVMENKLLSGVMERLGNIGLSCIDHREEEPSQPIAIDKLYFILMIHLFMLCLALICCLMEVIYANSKERIARK